jgi:hypothetical protein
MDFNMTDTDQYRESEGINNSWIKLIENLTYYIMLRIYYQY